MMRVAFALILVLMAVSAQAAAFSAWLENGTKKVRQDATPVTRDSITIKSARNEFEPFQLVFKNTSSASRANIDVSISDFTGTGTIPASNVTIFKEHYVNAPYESATEGDTGLWPDALLPKVDAYYGETRNTFPLSVAAGYIQPFWFDVFVPTNANAGAYTATVTVTQDGAAIYTGTVNLTVWPFAIPATSSLPSTFNADANGLWKGFSGLSFIPYTQQVNLHRDFVKAGLRHRITISPFYYTWGTWNGTTYSSLNTTYHNNSYVGFIDGTATGIEYGAAMTTSQEESFAGVYRKYTRDVSEPPSTGPCYDGTTTPPAAMLTEVSERARMLAASMTPEARVKTYILPIDEPGTGGDGGCGPDNPTLDYNSVKEISARIREHGLKVRITSKRKDELLNTTNSPATNDYIDRWTAYFQLVAGKDGSGNFVDNSGQYAADIANGASLWGYLSCMTAGCGIIGGSTYNGNPQYHMDYSALHARIVPWMFWRWGMQGERYWQSTAAFSVGAGYSGDPYASQWSTVYKKNSDGNFFYPGVVDTVAAGLPAGDGRGANTPSISGEHNIPIESIRLKMLREGREDYEYLKILADQGDTAYAQAQLATIVTNTYTFAPDESQLYTVREALANRITGAEAPSPSSPRLTGKLNGKLR